MDPEKVAQFIELTSATPQNAQSYLKVSDNNLEAALALFFDTGGVDIESEIPTASPSPPVRQAGTGSQPIDVDEDDVAEAMRASGPAAGGSNNYEDDEAMARRLQEEYYGSGGGSSSMGGDEVRAPLARTRETLVGPGFDDGYDYPPRSTRTRKSPQRALNARAKKRLTMSFEQPGLLEFSHSARRYGMKGLRNHSLPKNVNGVWLLQLQGPLKNPAMPGGWRNYSGLRWKSSPPCLSKMLAMRREMWKSGS
jgi:hypothetical protein